MYSLVISLVLVVDTLGWSEFEQDVYMDVHDVARDEDPADEWNDEL